MLENNPPVSLKMFTNERLFTIQALTITRVHCIFLIIYLQNDIHWRMHHFFKKICFYLENEEPHHHLMCVEVHSVCCCGFELKRGATVFAIIWAVLCLTTAGLQLLAGM